MARLQFKPSLDIPLQVPNFKPYTVSYPFRYRGRRVMRFPFLYDLADWVGVEDTVELYRVLPILEKMREKQLQVVGRQTYKNESAFLDRMSGKAAIEDNIKLSADFRQIATLGTHSLAAENRNIEISHSENLTADNKDIQVDGDLQLRNLPTLIEELNHLERLFLAGVVADLHHSPFLLGRTHHENNTMEEDTFLHSFRNLGEIAKQLQLSSVKNNAAISNDFQLSGKMRQLITYSTIYLENIIRSLENNTQSFLLSGQRLPDLTVENTQHLKIEETRFAHIVENMTATTPIAKDVSPQDSLLTAAKSFKYASTGEHTLTAVRTISAPFIIDAILTTQKNYKMAETVENFTYTTKHFHHSQIEKNSLVGLSRNTDNLSIQKPQDTLTRAGQNIHTHNNPSSLSRAGVVANIVQTTNTLTGAPHLSTTHQSHTPLQFAGTNINISTSLKWLSTIAMGVEINNQQALTKDKKIGRITEQVFVQNATKQIKVLDYWRLVSAGMGTASLGQTTKIKKNDKRITNNAQIVSLINTNKINTTVEDISHMAVNTPKVADVLSTVYHSSLYSRLWFIRDASGPYDPIILPSDYDYPVRLDTLQTPVEGHTKVEFQLRLKSYDTSLWFKVYDINYNLLSFIVVPNNTGKEWNYYNTTQQDVRLTINTVNSITNVEAILYNPKVAYIVLHHPEDSRGYRSWYAATQQILAQSHPIPIGNDLGLRELPVPIEIMIETINILLLMWGKFYMAFTGQTSQQALSGLCATFYEWITLQTSAERAGSNIKYYYRMWRWLRWEAEQMLERSKGDPTLSGNYWVEQLMAEMVEYMEQHHFDHMPLFKDLAQMDEHRDIFDSPEGDIACVLDKYKGLRNRRI